MNDCIGDKLQLIAKILGIGGFIISMLISGWSSFAGMRASYDKTTYYITAGYWIVIGLAVYVNALLLYAFGHLIKLTGQQLEELKKIDKKN